MKKTERDDLMNDEEGIFQRLMIDHRIVDQMLEQAISGDDSVDREQLVKQLKLEIMLHANVEDRVVYAELEQHGELKADIEHARDEHQEVEAILLELDGLKPGGRAMLGKLEELRSAIQEHVDEEENSIMPRAAKFFDSSSSRELGRRFEQEKEPEREVLMETEPGLDTVEPPEVHLGEDSGAEPRG
jgi:hypothetical protein